MKKIILMSLLVFSVFKMQAQESIAINLEKVLELGGANNLTIKTLQEQQNLANAELTKAQSWWLPEAYIGFQTHQLWGAVMNGNGRFFLDVSRQNLWGGLGVNANWDFAEGIYGVQAAELKSQAATFHTKSERNQILLQVIDAYYDLMTAQLNFLAYQNLANQADTIVQQIQIQVEVGLRYQSEFLLAKSNKNHLQVEMLNAKKAHNKASAQLKKLLKIAQNVQFVSTDETLLPLEFAEELQTFDASAYQKRAEIKANELEISALEKESKNYTTGLLLPELSVGVYGSYFGRIAGDVRPMDAATYPTTGQLYPTASLNMALMWKVPLSELTHKGESKKYSSLIQLKTLEAEQIKVTINEEMANALADLQMGKEQITIAKEALDLTTEALRQSIERQKIGTAKPFEVFQAQQFYLQAQLDYINVVGIFNKAQYALKVAKGEDL